MLLCCLSACSPEKPTELPETLIPVNESIDPDSTTIACIALNYQYTDLQKLLNWIDGGDSLRKAYGLTRHSVFRQIEDTTRVLELLRVDKFARGYEFANSTDLQKLADKYGFIGRPTVYLLNAVHMLEKTVGATCMLLQHDVRDFREWRKGFEKHNAVNDDENIKALCIFNTYKNPTKVSVLMEIKSIELAKSLVSSPETVAMMRGMGATTDPKMTILEVWR